MTQLFPNIQHLSNQSIDLSVKGFLDQFVDVRNQHLSDFLDQIGKFLISQIFAIYSGVSIDEVRLFL